MTSINQDLLKKLAPGTPIRDGLERIKRGRTGALIVLGFDDTVARLCDGGFELDVAFSPTRLRELCKMDGAVVLSCGPTGPRIKRANVQLVPDPSLPTDESGTRHRSAERTSLQTGLPVIAVSQSMNMITVYADGDRHMLKDSAEILARANQGLAVLERYSARLDFEEESLYQAEVAGFATAAEVIEVIRLTELLRRSSAAIHRDVVALGSDGHQLDVQLRELMADSKVQELLLDDYLVCESGIPSQVDIDTAQQDLAALPQTDLATIARVAHILGFPADQDSLAERVAPRGYRALSRIPRMQRALMTKIVEKYVTLPALLDATVDDIADIQGVGPLWARHVRRGLDRNNVG